VTEPNTRQVEVFVEQLHDEIAEMLQHAPAVDVAHALLFHAHTLAAQHGFAQELMAAHEALVEETETEEPRVPGTYGEVVLARGAVTPAACRRCTECEGEEHHFSAAMVNEAGDYECKHCDATAVPCDGCDAAVWPPQPEDVCRECLAQEPEVPA